MIKYLWNIYSIHVLLNTKLIFKNFVKYFEIIIIKMRINTAQENIKNKIEKLPILWELQSINNFEKSENIFMVKAVYIIIINYEKYIAKQ